MVSTKEIDKLKDEIMAGKRALQQLRKNKEQLAGDLKEDLNQINNLEVELEVTRSQRESHRGSPNKLVERLQQDNQILVQTVEN